MANSTLSKSDEQDVRRAMAGLSGSAAAHTAATLAAGLRTSTDVIYRISREVRKPRKKRADKGKRKQDLMCDDGLKFAAELVWNQKVNPDLALETAAANGAEITVSPATFRRYLDENHLGRSQKRIRKTYRRFEAPFAGHTFQFDISGVKLRWVDPRTKRIYKMSELDVSKNHTSRRADRVGLWKFVLVDDHSRLKYIRFIACSKPNSIHVIDFLRGAFAALGLCRVFYTDNDAILTSKRMKRGANILNEAFKDKGGFLLQQHAPGNPDATGKAERSHQIVEEFERLIGVKVEFGNEVTVEGLNKFAAWICDRYNTRVHSVTGEQPLFRFQRTADAMRIVNDAQFDAAFKAEDLLCTVAGDVTIRVKKVSYQLPRQAQYPFVALAETRQKIEVVWLDDADYFLAIVPDGTEYTIEKVIAAADVTDEHKTLPETAAQQNRKAIVASQKARIAGLKEQKKEILAEEPGADVQTVIVPGFDTDIAATNVTLFPRKIEMGDVETLDELTHYAGGDHSRELDLFDALGVLQAEEKVPSHPCAELLDAKTWLRGVFGDREAITENELHEAWNTRVVGPAAIPLRLAK